MEAGRVQMLLRGCLVIFLIAVMIWVAPDKDRLACWIIVLAHAGVSLFLSVLIGRRGHDRLGWLWLAPFFDVAVLVALAFLADESAATTWTADLLERGFFLVPAIAATLLKPRLVAAIILPTVVVYLATSLITGADDTEPIASVLLRFGVLTGLGGAAVLMSVVQRSRVRRITDLATDRAALLTEILDIENRERRGLAEELHDGALQYVLAARQDLESARDIGDEKSFERVEQALVKSSQLLRSTLSRLHPAAVEAAGVVPALRDLVNRAVDRGRLTAQLDVSGWRPGRTTADEVLIMTARELLTNVVKHADAHNIKVTLRRDEETAHLEVVDDGRGMAGVDLDGRLAAGHLGVASRRTRIAAAGGHVTFRSAEPHGTVVVVSLPLTPL